MGSFLRCLCIVGVIACVTCRPALAATAQADAKAEVVSQGGLCGSLESECAHFGVRMSATKPEMIVSSNTVIKFDVIGGSAGCSILLPTKLDLQNRDGRRVAVCSLSGILQQSSQPDLLDVVIKADLPASTPSDAVCAADFDVIIAYH